MNFSKAKLELSDTEMIAIQRRIVKQA